MSCGIAPSMGSSSSSELYRWLKQQEAEGSLDSSGSFTLEQGKAWEKLGAFQLPFAEAWILKLVQAGVAADFPLKVTQTREESTFHFDGASSWGRAALESAIFELEAAVDRALKHLAVGVRALAQLKTRPFSIRYPDGTHVAWTGKAFAEVSSGGESGSFAVSIANFEFGESKAIFSLNNFEAARFRAEVESVLASHCHLGPRTVEIDGVEVASLLYDLRFGVTDSSRPLTFLRAPEDQELPSFSVANPKEFHGRGLGGHFVDIGNGDAERMGPATACSAAAIVSVFVEKKKLRNDTIYYAPGRRRSEVIWVCDGVVVDREALRLEAGAGVAVIVSAEGLDTDLSGLLPRESDLKERLRELALRAVLPHLQQFAEGLGPGGVRVGYEYWGAVVKGILGGALTFVIPFIGLAMLTSAVYDYSSANRRSEELDRSFDQGMKDLVFKLNRMVGEQ